MPKRSLIKLLILSLVSLGTVITCTVLYAADIHRLGEAGTPGVPRVLVLAYFIIYPALCVCVGSVSGTEGRYMGFLPAAVALLISLCVFNLGIVFPYAALGYASFAISYFMSRFLRAHGGLERCVQDTLSKPLGIFILTTAYALAASLLLCPLDALDTFEKYEAPLFFTVPLGLIYYPLIFIITGAAAGRFPKKLWPVPLAVFAILFAVSNCYGSGIFALGYWNDADYYMRQVVPIMLVYLGLGYFALLLSRVFFWNRPELLIPRFWVALGTLAAGPLIFGVAYIPGFCWGHPLWGELLWYLLHLGLAVTVGILSGRNIKRYVLMPFFPLLVTYIQIYPPVIPGTEPKLPLDLGEKWCVICFFACALCMLLKPLLKPKNKRV